MVDIPIIEIGAGGAVAIIIIERVLGIIKNHRNNKNRDDGISRTEFEQHKKFVQTKDNCEQIVKRVDAAFEAQEKMFRMMEKRIEEHFQDVKRLIRNGGKG